MLTLGQFKRLMQEHAVPDDAPLCLPCDAWDVNSIDVNVNVVSILDAEYSHAKEFRVTLATAKTPTGGAVMIRRLVGQNKWASKIAGMMKL